MTLPSGGRGPGGRWFPADNAERDAIVTADGLELDDLCTVLADGGEYICTDPAVSTWVPEATGGNVNGPASSTDEAIARFNLATGKLLQNSLVTIDDTGNIVGPANFTLNNAASQATIGTGGGQSLLRMLGVSVDFRFIDDNNPAISWRRASDENRHWDLIFLGGVDDSLALRRFDVATDNVLDTPLSLNPVNGNVLLNGRHEWDTTGIFQGGTPTTDATPKTFRANARPYANADGPWRVFFALGDITSNQLALGGSAGAEGATSLEFWTSPTVNANAALAGNFDAAGDFNLTNRMLVGGAVASEAAGDADDIVVGPVSGGAGTSVIVDSPDVGFIGFVNGAATGTRRAGMQYNISGGERLTLRVGNSEEVRLSTVAFFPAADAGSGLGLTASNGWTSLAFAERADHVGVPTATRAEMWLDNETHHAARVTTQDGNDHQVHWRENRFQTVSSVANVDTTIATLTANGDAVMLNVQITGVEIGGANIISRHVIITYFQTAGVVTAMTAHLNDEQTTGAPTTVTALVVSGSNIIARVNGTALETHDWVVSWNRRTLGI